MPRKTGSPGDSSRLSESDEVSVSEDLGFEEIDSRSRRGATFPASVVK
jgi:hypothetical protein